MNVWGKMEKYKARVTAKGYSQAEGVDYNPTFSPIVTFESIRWTVSLGASKGLEVRKMDITTIAPRR